MTVYFALKEYFAEIYFYRGVNLMTTDSTSHGIVSRPMQSDEDFWRVRKLLIETYPITPPGFNWEMRRWDGWRFYNADPAWNPGWEKTVRLWESDDGKLVGAVHPEGRGNAFLELHPDYRHIEEEMIGWAEENLAISTKDSQRRLIIYVFEYDSPRRSLLKRRGYEKLSSRGVLRRLRFGKWPLVQPSPLPGGYTLRTTRPGDGDDCRRIADLLNVAFNRDFHTAGEFHEFTKHAPCFRNDLDLVAEAPDGSFAAYVGVPYNDVNRYGVFEPVCTHPDHQRKGLARSLMQEGLCRIKAIGAADVYVGTGDQIAANKLYDSMGFTEAYKDYKWCKAL
jgi:GNAT superfamily N-acetyltransferase